jgi:hypothetical protein
MTLLWCSGVRFVARLLDRREPERDRDDATVVRHPVSGWELRFDHEEEARRFLQRHCCEPSAFEITSADEHARTQAA